MDRQRPRGPALRRCNRSARATPSTAAPTPSTLHDPQEFSSYEGVLEPEGPGVWFDPENGKDPRWYKRWKSTERVELASHLPGSSSCVPGAPGARRPVSERFRTPEPASCACRHGNWQLVSICSRNVPDPAAPVASVRRARSRREHNASVDIIGIGPGPRVLPRTPLRRSSQNSPSTH